MCLLLIAVDVVPDVPLLLLGNRDEFHERPSATARPWSEDERIVGGRDLVAGGSWLAVRADGRFAAVTNLRTGVPATAPRSRGWLVRDFVLGDMSAVEYLDLLHADVESYGPFNLVLGDRNGAWARGSADAAARRLDTGVHVVSNGPIGVHWPKTERLQERFIAEVRAASAALRASDLLDLLADEWRAPDSALPDTGVGAELERVLAPVFIRGEKYGTRASTLVGFGSGASVALYERSYAAGGVVVATSGWISERGERFVEAGGENGLIG